MEHPSSPVFLTAEWCRNVIGELLDGELLEYIGTVSTDIVLVRRLFVVVSVGFVGCLHTCTYDEVVVQCCACQAE